MPDYASLLFLCTGNYYRSRFAEILFNWLAAGAGLDFRASSRGLATEVITPERGPISPLVATRLQEKGFDLAAPIRFPQQLAQPDLMAARRIIALDEPEHRPLLELRYPGWADRIEYWHIPDLHLLPAGSALDAIEQEISRLIREYSPAGSLPGQDLG